MKRLGVKGVNTTISLRTMERGRERERESRTRKCELVQLDVFDLEEENFIELPLVFSIPKLPLASESVPRQDDVDRWPHLKGVTVAEINADVGLLIGHDVRELERVRMEVRVCDHDVAGLDHQWPTWEERKR